MRPLTWQPELRAGPAERQISCLSHHANTISWRRVGQACQVELAAQCIVSLGSKSQAKPWSQQGHTMPVSWRFPCHWQHSAEASQLGDASKDELSIPNGRLTGVEQSNIQTPATLSGDCDIVRDCWISCVDGLCKSRVCRSHADVYLGTNDFSTFVMFDSHFAAMTAALKQC